MRTLRAPELSARGRLSIAAPARETVRGMSATPDTILRAYGLLLDQAPPPASPLQLGSVLSQVAVQRAAARRALVDGRWDGAAELARLRRVQLAVAAARRR